MYDEKQLENIIKHLKEKYMFSEIEPYELVVALLAMVRAGKISEEQMARILMEIFLFNKEAVKRALDSAQKIVDDEMINEIINRVEK